ncbi:hypothetical protein AMECASPLE_039671 [Ameca splendens]|uniref:Uncharacterized protein n=1 Tax=Ameca splendens TaxID=208324 RepID=A0ABV0YK10_9TELE
MDQLPLSSNSPLCLSVTQLDDSALTLNSSVQTVHGVKLSKDQTGVTAKVSLSNFKVSVFFDGSIAQIHLEGREHRMSLGHDECKLCCPSSAAVFIQFER